MSNLLCCHAIILIIWEIQDNYRDVQFVTSQHLFWKIIITNARLYKVYERAFDQENMALKQWNSCIIWRL